MENERPEWRKIGIAVYFALSLIPFTAEGAPYWFYILAIVNLANVVRLTSYSGSGRRG